MHEYELADGVTEEDFLAAVREAEQRGLFDLEGLRDHTFLRGMRGAREGKFAAIWCWESQEAWEELWGPVQAPKPKSEFPEGWKVWEDELLDPLLSGDPDRIRFTSYRRVRP